MKYLSKPLNGFLAVSDFQIYIQSGLKGFSPYINEMFILYFYFRPSLQLRYHTSSSSRILPCKASSSHPKREKMS